MVKEYNVRHLHQHGFPMHYGPPPSFATYCNMYVLSRCVTFSPFYVSRFRRDCRGRFLNCQNICHGVHGYHGLLLLAIPFPCVASRLSRFDHGCLKRGRRNHREHSVNATIKISFKWKFYF